MRTYYPMPASEILAHERRILALEEKHFKLTQRGLCFLVVWRAKVQARSMLPLVATPR